MSQMQMTKDEFAEHVKDIVEPLIKANMEPEVRDVVRERVEDQINQSPEKSVAEKVLGDEKPQADPNESKFGSFVRALVQARKEGGGREMAAKIAENRGQMDVAAALRASEEKALASNDGQAGGFLVPTEFSNEVIELRRATGVVRSLNPTVIPMTSGNLDMGRINQGATATYGAENANIGKTEQKFGNLKLSFKKLSCFVPISNDLIRYSSPGVDAIVRDDCVAAMSAREDLAFIGDDGTSGKPKGILNWVHGDNKFDADSASLANVTNNLGKAMQKLMDANIALAPQQGASVTGERAGWIFKPQIWQYLFTVQTGLGTHAFMPEMQRGTLLGFPFRVTTQASASALGRSSGDDPVIFGSFRHAAIGESLGISVDASDTAAYYDGSSVQAAYTLDQTVIRVIAENDFVLRHDKAFAVIENVAWGS